jgi:chromosome partitioning protein
LSRRSRAYVFPRVIVVANEKGGSGKSTVGMHPAIALIKSGQRIATINRLA